MDFIVDGLATGRMVRILSVVDVYTRECLALEADTSLGSGRVTRVLERLIGERSGDLQKSLSQDGLFASYETKPARAFQQSMQAELLQMLNDMQQPHASPAEFKGGSYDFVNRATARRRSGILATLGHTLGTKENCALNR
jgi:hypothetical protein